MSTERFLHVRHVRTPSRLLLTRLTGDYCLGIISILEIKQSYGELRKLGPGQGAKNG